MQCPDQKPNGLRQPGLLPFSARGRCYPGNLGLKPVPVAGFFLNFFRFGNAPTHASPVCAVGPGNR